MHRHSRAAGGAVGSTGAAFAADDPLCAGAKRRAAGRAVGHFRVGDFRGGAGRVWAMVWTFIVLYSLGVVSIALAGKFGRAA